MTSKKLRHDSQLHTAFQRGVTGSEKLFTVQTFLTFHNKLTLKVEGLMQHFEVNTLCILPCLSTVPLTGSQTKNSPHIM